MKKLILLGFGFAMSGCASVVDGTSQQIALDSNPPGAECLLTRKGAIIGKTITPGAVHIKKTKHDIDVSCSKQGYQTSSAHIKSEIQDSTWGNIILGGGIGWAIDSASGADNKYQDHITVTLAPDIEALKASLAEQAKTSPDQEAARSDTAVGPGTTSAAVAPAVEATPAQATSTEAAAPSAPALDSATPAKDETAGEVKPSGAAPAAGATPSNSE